jgi:hypothetical protein
MVDNFEVKPASMTSSVGVDPQMNIVLIFSYFCGDVQISTFKVASKLYSACLPLFLDFCFLLIFP